LFTFIEKAYKLERLLNSAVVSIPSSFVYQ